MPKPLLPPITGKTPPADGRNVIVLFANINGTETWCDMEMPVGLNRFKARPVAPGGSTDDFTIVTLTNGSTANPKDAWIQFKREDNTVGYVKLIMDTKLVDWDGNEYEWHCPGIGPQDRGVYVSSNWQDVSK